MVGQALLSLAPAEAPAYKLRAFRRFIQRIAANAV